MDLHELALGDFVVVEADDHWENDDPTDDDSVEYPFEVWGEVTYIGPRQIVVEGAWVWMCDDDWMGSEYRVSYGRFGIVVSAISRIRPHPGPGIGPS
jgi:hypothetical protein